MTLAELGLLSLLGGLLLIPAGGRRFGFGLVIMARANWQAFEWSRRKELVRAIAELFYRDDVEEPVVLDERTRESLRVVLRIVAESETVFRQVRRRAGPPIRTEATDYLCDSITSGMGSLHR